MAYSRHTGRKLIEYLEADTACEELELPQGNFVARMGKSYRKITVIYATVSLCLGLFLLFLDNKEWGDIAPIFLTLGGLLLLVTPTFLTYRCEVNKFSLQEEYWILCFKRKKEVFWEDIKYKKIKYKKRGNEQISSISFYDANKKRLMGFDSLVVGVRRISKMAKRSSILKLEK